MVWAGMSTAGGCWEPGMELATWPARLTGAARTPPCSAMP